MTTEGLFGILYLTIVRQVVYTNTKEQILDAALELFSEKGYGAVSVRTIAHQVGIKESSLYYHFQNKRDIFDTLVARCFAQAERYYRSQALPFAPEDDAQVFSGVTKERLTELIFTTFGYFFDDPQNRRFRKLLTVSQFDDVRSGEIYRQLYGEYPVKVQSKIFAKLMDQGEFRRADPEAVAREFYGVVFLLLNTCGSLEEAKPCLMAHIQEFTQNYWTKG